MNEKKLNIRINGYQFTTSYTRYISLDVMECPTIFEEEIVDEFMDKHGLLLDFETNEVSYDHENISKEGIPTLFFSDVRIKLKLRDMIDKYERECDDFCSWEKAEREYDEMKVGY